MKLKITALYNNFSPSLSPSARASARAYFNLTGKYTGHLFKVSDVIYVMLTVTKRSFFLSTHPHSLGIIKRKGKNQS